MIITEHEMPIYPPRTRHNAKTSDVTVAFAEDYESHGEQLTIKEAGNKYFPIPLSTDTLAAARLLFAKCREKKCKILNIAGNGIYSLDKHGWTQEKLNRWMYDVLKLVHTHYPLEKVISGGQTGVDMAGCIAAEVLGIPNEMTLPKGYLQRTLKEKHKIQSYQEIYGTCLGFINTLERELKHEQYTNLQVSEQPVKKNKIKP